MTRLRFVIAFLAAILIYVDQNGKPLFAQDISNPACNGPWTSYTATAVAQTPGVTPPTLTRNASRYKLCGNKTLMLEADFTVTAAGTGTGSINITLPFTAASNTATFSGSSVEYSVLGIGGWAIVLPGGTTINAKSAVNATPFLVTGQAIAVGINYEIP